MKRLLSQIGMTYLFVLAVVFYFNKWLTLAIAFVFLGVTVVLFLVYKTRKTVFMPVMALSAAVACLVNFVYTISVFEPTVNKYDNISCKIEATLTDEAYNYYSNYIYKLKTKSVDGKDENIRIILMSEEKLDIEPFDILTFNSKLEKTNNKTYISKGYFLQTKPDELEYSATKDDGFHPYLYAIKIRQFFRKKIDALLPEKEAGLCKAILIGDKYSLDESIKENFKYSGASYFIVVSGMHFTILSIAFLWIFKIFFKKRFIYIPATMLFALLYMAITGFAPSVIRSGIMILVTLFAMLIKRDAYPFNSLGIAVVLISIFFTPYSPGDIGLVLSFAATFSILLWSKPIYNKIKIKSSIKYEKLIKKTKSTKDENSKNTTGDKNKIELKRKIKNNVKCISIHTLNWFLSALAVALSANILVVPISIFVFKSISLVTLFSALILYIPVEMILIFSVISCILYAIPVIKFLGIIFSWALYFCSKFVIFIVDTLSSFKYSYVYVRENFVFLWLVFSIVLGLIILMYKNNYKYFKYAALSSICILLTGFLLTTVLSYNNQTLNVYKCDKGLSVSYDSNGSVAMLDLNCDTYSAFDVVSNLETKNKDEISFALCQNKREINNYSKAMSEKLSISNFLLQGELGESKINSDKISKYSKKTVVNIDNHTSITVMDIDGVLVQFINSGAKTALIIPSRIDAQKIPDKYRAPDIIVINRIPENFSVLICDTLVVSDTKNDSYITLREMRDIYNKAMISNDGDINIRMEK